MRRSNVESADGVYGCFACTPLGEVLVASSANGVCALEFVCTDRRDALDVVRRRFPDVCLTESLSRLNILAIRCITVMFGFSDGNEGYEGMAEESPPLDLRGTSFQLEVWRRLLEIPRGETRTYAEIARLTGNPSAVRAVANAIAANPVAVIVPCHRVVRSDGTAGGYRWGTRLKTRLLDLEMKVGLSPVVFQSRVSGKSLFSVVNL